jgi:hydroxymethylglutaryl-CoA lyase
MKNIALVECPRDAMQGWHHFIKTDDKVNYLNALMQVGFHTLDCLSFVSARAIPQMADSAEVAERLMKNGSATRILAIVLNKRGALEALAHPVIDVLGFPFSISPTFQRLNGNNSLEENWDRLCEIKSLADSARKEMVVYLSMGFGNPYGDEYNPEGVLDWAAKIGQAGIQVLSLADTVGIATPVEIAQVVKMVKQNLPDLEVGVHLHSSPQGHNEKLMAALHAGAVRLDAAIGGFGGCPMAGDELVGNMNTRMVLNALHEQGAAPQLNAQALQAAEEMAVKIFVP